MSDSTAPEFAPPDDRDDDIDISKDEALTPRPPKDPSMDTLLEGLAGRIEQTAPMGPPVPSSRRRARRPPEAHTDPLPEPAVALRDSVVLESFGGRVAKRPRPADRTVVVPRDTVAGIRLPAIVLTAAVVLLLGVIAIWFRGAEPEPPAEPLAALPPAVVPAPVASVVVVAPPPQIAEPAPSAVAPLSSSSSSGSSSGSKKSAATRSSGSSLPSYLVPKGPRD